MIISASRRTDIPAFYAQWFINRIRAGFCTVPNPFNSNQVSHIELSPEKVDVLVFWTRYPRPLFRYLDELDRAGYKYYFQFTVLNNPRTVDPKSPDFEKAINTFRELADRIGPERVIWRYDPILFTESLDSQYHLDTYGRIASALQGATRRSVISIMDPYPKIAKRMKDVAAQGYTALKESRLNEQINKSIPGLVEISCSYGMEIFSCAEDLDLSPYGVNPGKCIDDDYIKRIFGISVTAKKDPSQRKQCGCVLSKDIGMYDSCVFECQYCYATRSFDLAKRQHSEHDPNSPSLIGWFKSNPTQTTPDPLQQHQLSLWSQPETSEPHDSGDS